MPEASQNSRGNDFQNLYDLADFIEKGIGGNEIGPVQSLNPDEKYCSYNKKDSLLRKACTKSKKMFHISYKKEWINKYCWHSYSPYLNGGLSKVCELFDNPDAKNRRTFVKKAFEDISNPEKIVEHNGLQYHEAAMLKAHLKMCMKGGVIVSTTIQTKI